MAKIHHWKMDLDAGQAKDYVGTAHGTLIGTTEVDGLFGVARQFTSTNRINIGNPGDFAFGTGDFSIFAWVNMSAMSDNWNMIMSKDAVGSRGWYLGVNLAAGEFIPRMDLENGSGTWTQVKSPYAIEANKWYHIGVTKTGTTYKMYINGSVVAEVTGQSNVANSTSDAWIGNHTSDTLHVFTGKIDNVEIWNEQLSDQDVLDMSFTAEAPPESDPNTMYLTGRTPAHLDTGVAFDTDIDLTLADSGNNSVVQNSITITVDGVTAYTSSAFNTPTYDGTVIGDGAGGFEFSIDPGSDIAEDNQADITVTGQNDAGGQFYGTYYFNTLEDITPPAWYSRDPAPSASNQTTDKTVSFKAKDDETGIDISSLLIWIDQGSGYEVVYDHDGGTWQGSWTGTGPTAISGVNHYEMSINAPGAGWPNGGSVTVSGYMQNLSDTPEELSDSYSFDIQATAGITNLVPIPDASNINVADTINMKFEGGSGNIVKNTVKVYINDVLAFDGSATPGQEFKTPYIGNASQYSQAAGDLTLVIDPDPDFYENMDMEVAASGENDLAQIATADYSFEIQTVGSLKNSSMEAPGASPGQMKEWTWSGIDDDLGTKRGRVENPDAWAPETGDHVAVLGSTDLNDAEVGSQYLSQSADLTGRTELYFDYRIQIPETLEGDYTIQCVIQQGGTTHVLWTRSYTPSGGDDSGFEEGRAVVDVSAYSGTWTIRFEYIYS